MFATQAINYELVITVYTQFDLISSIFTIFTKVNKYYVLWLLIYKVDLFLGKIFLRILLTRKITKN